MQSHTEHTFNFNKNAYAIDAEASAPIKRQHAERFL